MTARRGTEGEIVLEGDCTIDDSEALLRLLLDTPSARVDWRGCTHAHTAILQVLLAARPAMIGPPAGAALRDWLENLLAGRSAFPAAGSMRQDNPAVPITGDAE
jgi:hypothetical protein